MKSFCPSRPAVDGQLMEGASQSAAKKDSEPDRAQKKRRRPLSSDQDNDEDGDLTSGPKKTRGLPLGTKSEPDRASSREPRESDGEDGEPAAKGGSQLEVVLSAFVNFCQQYRETVESAAVRKSIDRFSKNVEVKLLEKISCLKEFRPLKRENTKMASLIQSKSQKLLKAKQELMRAEKEASLLQKKKAELQQRLADLRRGRAFLQDIRGLTTQYLAYPRRKPTEKKTYGGSSLAALLLETKLTQRASRRRTRAAQQARK
ncbi:centromere protein U-like [Cyprinodon tularosa]|uniref:centromere protein U-like n=1 Tax=Cyprinodon tularosa TaxID=77115 RepID=UPI0018E27CC0|nr:centromere protein U-like [Cyprinodon tularosa]